MLQKILLVEDDATMRNLLSTLLKLEGYNPILYQESRDHSILDTLHNELPDAVILDVHLKYANGLEILRQVRQINTFDTVIIILTSGLDYRAQCREMGGNGFLQKPYMPDELLNFLKENLP